ncbi:hypothetical protein KAR91_02165 [Candidatus Pacearchaeota archaeon]|nr:hypothetical protein [Candidatus Pacearchaeota archaeon]
MSESKFKDLKCECGEFLKWENVRWTSDFTEFNHECPCGKRESESEILKTTIIKFLNSKNDTAKLKDFIENDLGKKWEPKQKGEI